MTKLLIKEIASEYHTDGNGPAIVMLHGWQDNLHSFDAITRNLEKQHKIVRIDLPGFGYSEKPKSDWTLSNYADFVSEMIERLEITPAAILGHSFGGRVLVKMHEQNQIPDKTKIILMAAAGVTKRGGPKQKIYFVAAKIMKGILKLPILSRYEARIKNKFYKNIQSDYAATGKMKKIFLNTIKEDLSVAAGHIKNETLLIWGENDDSTPIVDAKKFNRLIKNSQLKTFSGAGHFVHKERSDEVAKAIKKFVS